MKYLLLLFSLLIFTFCVNAQQKALKTVYVNENISTHFICSEPVQYVDLSTDEVIGDLPLSNIVRIRPKETPAGELGVVTIVAQQYIIQYQMVYANSGKADKQVFIRQEDGLGLMLPEITLTHDEMKSFSTQAFQAKIKKPKERKRAYGIEAQLNQIYTVGDYYLVDISVLNKTKIPYDFDQIRFKIEDKKIAKATNVQAVEIKPEFQLYHQKSFKKQYRNVFVFKKFTYPNKKVFTIELSEKQISGRNIKLEIDYRKILNADIL